LILALIWGWSFVFIKVAVRGMTPVTVSFTRVFLGMLVLIVLLRRRGLSLPHDRATWRHVTLMAILYNALPFTLLAWGEQHITSALASVLNAATPLFAGAIGALAFEERLPAEGIVGLVLGFAGVAVAAGVGASDLTSSSRAGAVAAVLAALCYGISFHYFARHLTRIDPIVATSGQLIAGSLLLFPFAVFTTVTGPGLHLTPGRVLSITLLGVFGTGLAYVINYRSIAELGGTRASIVTYLVPIVAVVVGVVVLDEHLSARLPIGGVLVALGAALVQGRLRFTTATSDRPTA
jgi:drug/metabolite transporter (DMT)-like permease